MRKSEPLSYARQDDDTLFWIGHKKPPRCAVALKADTTPIIMQLLDESSLKAADLIHCALLAVWLARTKYTIQQATQGSEQRPHTGVPYVGDILKGMIDDTKGKIQVHKENRRRNKGRSVRRDR